MEIVLAMRWRYLAFGFVFSVHLVSGYTGMKMGVADSLCDDGQSRLEVDWDNDFREFTCPEDEWPAKVIAPSYYEIPNFDPTTDEVNHFCMNTTIPYVDAPPLRGPHRPNWAIYGEYLYLPPQRWLHNLEHGSIIMLYHPCVDLDELRKLRTLVTSCLYRHVITPYRHLPRDYPLALISWGAKLQMNMVDVRQAVAFIQKHARKAPEDTSKQGMYSKFLLQPSTVVPGSDIDDSELCPHLSGAQNPIEDPSESF